MEPSMRVDYASNRSLSAPVVPNNSIRRDSRGEAESAHYLGWGWQPVMEYNGHAGDAPVRQCGFISFRVSPE
jgi:hypothetical protein